MAPGFVSLLSKLTVFPFLLCPRLLPPKLLLLFYTPPSLFSIFLHHQQRCFFKPSLSFSSSFYTSNVPNPVPQTPPSYHFLPLSPLFPSLLPPFPAASPLFLPTQIVILAFQDYPSSFWCYPYCNLVVLKRFCWCWACAIEVEWGLEKRTLTERRSCVNRPIQIGILLHPRRWRLPILPKLSTRLSHITRGRGAAVGTRKWRRCQFRGYLISARRFLPMQSLELYPPLRISNACVLFWVMFSLLFLCFLACDLKWNVGRFHFFSCEICFCSFFF